MILTCLPGPRTHTEDGGVRQLDIIRLLVGRFLVGGLLGWATYQVWKTTAIRDIEVTVVARAAVQAFLGVVSDS
jgi:hypothetical protein